MLGAVDIARVELGGEPFTVVAFLGHDAAPNDELRGRLTPAERDVLEHLLGGATDREIAAVLGKARRTVTTQVQSILSKLGASSRAELVALLSS